MSSLVPFKNTSNFSSYVLYIVIVIFFLWLFFLFVAIEKWDLLLLLLNLLITNCMSGTIIRTEVQNRTNKLPTLVKPKITVVVPHSK